MSSIQSKKVLLGSSATFHTFIVEHDKFLTTALRQRGARVEALLCGGALPACEVCTVSDYTTERFLGKGPQANHCGPCRNNGLRAYRKVGVPVHEYSGFLSPEDKVLAEEQVENLPSKELASFLLEDIRLGEEALAGTLRFFTVGSLDGIPMADAILRRYLVAAILAMRVSQRSLRKIQPDAVVFHHGIYVPLGVLGQVARKLGVRVVNWALGYRKQCFVYSHHDTYHRTMIDEPVEAWCNRPLKGAEESQLMDYLNGRMTSKHDWIKHHVEPEDDPVYIRSHLQLDSRPIILALTNVTWDAQLFYQSNAFPSIIDWLCHTIHAIGQRSDLQLVVRVHPSEVRGNMPTRQPIMTIVSKRIPEIPENVYIVSPESRISTYTLGDMADCAIIYGTKTGVELTCRGVPVIVCGEAWIRNKGLTVDVSSPEHYDEVLSGLPFMKRMPDEQVALARRYAYHYFFRRLLPIGSLAPRTKKEYTSFSFKLLRRLRGLRSSSDPFAFKSDLLNSNDPAVAAVMDGIIDGKPFIAGVQSDT